MESESFFQKHIVVISLSGCLVVGLLAGFLAWYFFIRKKYPDVVIEQRKIDPPPKQVEHKIKHKVINAHKTELVIERLPKRDEEAEKEAMKSMKTGEKDAEKGVKVEQVEAVHNIKIGESRTVDTTVSIIDNDDHIVNYMYYHGLMNVPDSLFKRKGDFVVFACNEGIPTIMIKCRAVNHIETIDLERIGNKVRVKAIFIGEINPWFDNINELLLYHRTCGFIDSVPKRPLPRSPFFVSHLDVEMDLNQLLGAGDYGAVYKGTFGKTGKDVVAVKVVHHAAFITITSSNSQLDGDKKKVNRNERKRIRKRNYLLEEGELLGLMVGCPYVVQLLGIVCDSEPVKLVMEYCAGGNLLSHLQKVLHIQPKERWMYALHLIRGLEYIHSMDVVHRDICCSNLLIDRHGFIKIADFGAAIRLNGKKERVVPTFGTRAPVYYMPPECLQDNNATFSRMSDIYSFGVAIFEIEQHGLRPYPGSTSICARFKILKGVTPYLAWDTPKPMIEMMKKVWSYDRHKRPTAAKIEKEISKLLKEIGVVRKEEAKLNEIEGVKWNSGDLAVTNGPDFPDTVEEQKTQEMSTEEKKQPAPATPQTKPTPTQTPKSQVSIEQPNSPTGPSQEKDPLLKPDPGLRV